MMKVKTVKINTPDFYSHPSNCSNYKEIYLLDVNNYRFDIYAFKNNHLIKLLFELDQKIIYIDCKKLIF